jgi:hypothetical protein
MSSQMEHPETAGEQVVGGAGAQPGAAGASREAGPAGAGGPSEEQLRAAYEAELSRITSVDMVLQAAASLLNIGAHRLGLTGGPGAASPPAQRDVEQVRDAIDAVRGLMPVIERSAPGELRPLRDALSQLQMAYSRVVQAAPVAQAPTAEGPPTEAPVAGVPTAETPAGEPGAPATPPVSPPASPPQGGTQGEQSGPGPAESSGRLWVPGR